MLKGKRPPNKAALLHGDGLHSPLDFVSEPVEMFMKPVKHVALGLTGGKRGFRAKSAEGKIRHPFFKGQPEDL
jgi:hypothetical protein